MPKAHAITTTAGRSWSRWSWSAASTGRPAVTVVAMSPEGASIAAAMSSDVGWVAVDVDAGAKTKAIVAARSAIRVMTSIDPPYRRTLSRPTVHSMKSPVHDLDFGAAAQALSALDHLDVPELEVLYRLELNGADVYEQMADRLDDDAVADVLRRNGREELGHAKRIRRIIAIKVGDDYEEPSYLADRWEVALPDHIAPEILVAMVDGERGGQADYERWAASEPDPEVARLLRVSGQEELKHAERLAAVLG